MTRRQLFGVAAASRGLLAEAAYAASALGRGARYLWDMQSDDGGWHSSTYGLMRSGQSLTPFLLDTLLLTGARPDGPAVGGAVRFILDRINRGGALGLADYVTDDYPNYATSAAIMALVRAGRHSDTAPMLRYLRAQQFTEQNGWTPQDPPYGAWGMGGEPRRKPSSGHVDLSMTRMSLQALAAAGARSDDEALVNARVYLDRSQNTDGGFYFSTVIYGANKAGRAHGRYRSYGTATCDGILSLQATGSGRTDPRVVFARRWLERNAVEDGIPGLTAEEHQPWNRGLRFYWAAVSAECGVLPPGLRRSLLDEQRPDGSWLNADSLVKEDDPLIATALALRALAFPEGHL